jgi:hypothetical protein
MFRTGIVAERLVSSIAGRLRRCRTKPELDQPVQEKFVNTRFIPANPVDLLDYSGTELIMVGAMEDIHKELSRRDLPTAPHSFENLKL